MADPHISPRILDDQATNKWPEHFYGLAKKGWRIYQTSKGPIARKDNKLVLPNSIQQPLRRKLMEAADNKCTYCCEEVVEHTGGSTTYKAHSATIDHRVPLIQGGTWKRNNLICCCNRCNTLKADLSEQEFRALFAQFPYEKSGRHIGRIRNAVKNIVSKRAKEKHRMQLEGLNDAV